MANMQNQLSEFQIQMVFHQWCKKSNFIILSWHVPNGLKSAPEYVKKMKLIGLTRGIPDYWIILKNNKILAIEFKTSIGKLSEEQEEIRTILNNNPYIHYRECRSSHEAVNFVKEMIGG